MPLNAAQLKARDGAWLRGRNRIYPSELSRDFCGRRAAQAELDPQFLLLEPIQEE
jgi:hypothetical protein